MDDWLTLGGPHHFVINLGEHADRWRRLAELLDIEYVGNLTAVPDLVKKCSAPTARWPRTAGSAHLGQRERDRSRAGAGGDQAERGGV